MILRRWGNIYHVRETEVWGVLGWGVSSNYAAFGEKLRGGLLQSCMILLRGLWELSGQVRCYVFFARDDLPGTRPCGGTLLYVKSHE